MKVVEYKNVHISVKGNIDDELIQIILQRAANKTREHCFPGEMTLQDAVNFRNSGDNYQFCDEVATRAFEHELHKHLRPNP
jgi:hypothetical protein